MHGPIGVVGFLFALALGVVMMVFDGFEMPRALVFFAQRVIQAHIEGPLVALVGVGHQVRHDKVAERGPEVLGRPGTDAQRVRPIRGVGSIDNASIETGNSFMPCFRDDQRISEAQHMLPLWLAQTQVQTTQKGQEVGRMLYNELEQGDILSGVRFGLALLAYTDILLCSIWAIYKIRQTPRASQERLMRLIHLIRVTKVIRVIKVYLFIGERNGRSKFDLPAYGGRQSTSVQQDRRGFVSYDTQNRCRRRDVVGNCQALKGLEEAS